MLKPGQMVLKKVSNSVLPKGYSERGVTDYSPTRIALPYMIEKVNVADVRRPKWIIHIQRKTTNIEKWCISIG